MGFGRLDGRSVGVVANQPKKLAGCLDIDGADKASRLLDSVMLSISQSLHWWIPQDIYLGQDRSMGESSDMGLGALCLPEATVPKVTLILRKAYGGAYLAMCSKAVGADQVFAWPSAEVQ